MSSQDRLVEPGGEGTHCGWPIAGGRDVNRRQGPRLRRRPIGGGDHPRRLPVVAEMRLEVVASTDRLVERVRAGLTGVSATPEPSEAE